MNQPTSPPREIRAIRTGPRSTSRTIKRMKTKEGDFFVSPTDYGKEARCELDTRADTTCAGINCRPLYYTGQHCEAFGFHNELSPISDVPIATLATAPLSGATVAMAPLSGESFIIIFNKALYFGSNLDHSLVNPNQLRHHGIDIYDNPYESDPD